MSRATRDPVNSMGWRTAFRVHLDDRVADAFGKWCANQGFERGQEHHALALLVSEYFASTPDAGSAAWARAQAFNETRQYTLRRVMVALQEIARDIKNTEIDGGQRAG